MRTFLISLATVLLAPTAFSAQSSSQNIFVEVNGQRYQCDGTDSPNAQCIPDVSDFCYSFTSQSRNKCYETATNACRGQRGQFASCVSETANYCYSNTSNSKNKCFSLAVQSCSGNFQANLELMDEVKTFSKNN